MFQPAFIGQESLGIHELVYNSIMKSDIDLRKELWQSIVLAGGNTSFPGFSERLHKELTALAPKNTTIKIIASPTNERKYMAWVGGSIWSTLLSSQSKWITREEYEEVGPAIVHTRGYT